MTDREILKQVKKLSNGKFGKPIVVTGDGMLVLDKLMKIYVLVHNHLTANKEIK